MWATILFRQRSRPKTTTAERWFLCHNWFVQWNTCVILCPWRSKAAVFNTDMNYVHIGTKHSLLTSSFACFSQTVFLRKSVNFACIKAGHKLLNTFANREKFATAHLPTLSVWRCREHTVVVDTLHRTRRFEHARLCSLKTFSSNTRSSLPISASGDIFQATTVTRIV